MLYFLIAVTTGIVFAAVGLWCCIRICQGQEDSLELPTSHQPGKPLRLQPPVQKHKVYPPIPPPKSPKSYGNTPTYPPPVSYHDKRPCQWQINTSKADGAAVVDTSPPIPLQQFESPHLRPSAQELEIRSLTPPPPSYGGISTTPQQLPSSNDTRHVEELQETDAPALEAHQSLRAMAKKEGGLMSRCYQQSQDAYKRNNHARAKTLSEQAKRHALQRDVLNAKASEMVFKQNNLNKPSGQVDLHGLYVKEAINRSETTVVEALRRGDSEIRLIVGQGIHSEGGVARIKPAVQKHLRKRGLDVRVDSKNSGVLVVRLNDE